MTQIGPDTSGNGQNPWTPGCNPPFQGTGKSIIRYENDRYRGRIFSSRWSSHTLRTFNSPFARVSSLRHATLQWAFTYNGLKSANTASRWLLSPFNLKSGRIAQRFCYSSSPAQPLRLLERLSWCHGSAKADLMLKHIKSFAMCVFSVGVSCNSIFSLFFHSNTAYCPTERRKQLPAQYVVSQRAQDALCS
jgi:hypothetical protein